MKYLVVASALIYSTASAMQEKTDFRVNDDGGTVQQSSPTIAVAGDGSFAVAWVDRRNGTADIYLQRYGTRGQKVGRNIVVNDSLNTYQFAPALHTDIFGRFSSVWLDYREGNYPFNPNVFMQRFDTAVTPTGANVGVSLEAVSSVKEAPDLSLSSWGTGVVVWADNRNGDWDIYGQLISSNGNLIGGNFLINDDTASAQQHAPRVSSSPEGWFVVTWYDNRMGDDDIFVQRFDSIGTPLGVNVKVNTDAPGNRQSHPDVATDGAGHFTIVWVDWRNGSYPSNPDIYSCRLDTFMLPMTPNILVNTDNASTAQRQPAIAADRMGNVAIIWSDSMGSSLWDITGQMLDVDGIVRESNFRANSVDSSIQLTPAVALDGQYRYIAWADYRNGNYDIYASITKYNDRGIVVTPAAVNFDMAAGGTIPDPVDLRVDHSGYNPVDFHVTGGAGWLDLSSTGGTTPAVIAVVVNTDTLNNGTYLAQLTFVDNNTHDSTTVVSVRLDITSPVMSLSADTLTFVGHEEIPATLYENVVVTNIGQGVLRWNIMFGPSWATVTPDSGDAPTTVSIGVDPSTLTAGEYIEPLIFESAGAGNSPDTVWLKATVLAQTPEFAVAPSSIYSTVDSSEQFSAQLAISNIGGGNLQWTATASDNWLIVTPLSGGDGDTISISAADSLYTPGQITSSLILSDPQAINSPVTVPIIMEIKTPPDTTAIDTVFADTLILDSVDVLTGESAGMQLNLRAHNTIKSLMLPVRFDQNVLAIDSISYSNTIPAYVQKSFAYDNELGVMKLTLKSSTSDSSWMPSVSTLSTVWLTASGSSGRTLVQAEFNDTLSPQVITDQGDTTGLTVLSGAVSINAPTAVVDQIVDLPGDFELEQNYPNPFNLATTIEYALPVNSIVNLEIYNILGQRVAQLINGSVASGRYRITWDGRFESGREVPSGIYFYRLRSGSTSLVRKMVLIK